MQQQVNNQPPVLGEMAAACGVINAATKGGGKPLVAVSEMLTFLHSNGTGWCYNFTYNPKLSLLWDAPKGYNSYTYQCCTQATVYSSELPAKADDDGTLNPEQIPVPVSEIKHNCRWVSGRRQQRCACRQSAGAWGPMFQHAAQPAAVQCCRH